MITQEKIVDIQTEKRKTPTNYKKQIPKTQPEIVIKDLVKNFGAVKAINGLNLKIYRGEMFGFYG